MATHTPHDEIVDHGLADGCERCGELAGRPLELNPGNFKAAWQRMLSSQFNTGERRLAPRSFNEAKLLGLLYTWAVFLEKWTPLDPRELPDEWDRLAA